MDEPDDWLSVVTVVKDDLEGFQRTLASLRAQDLDGVKFIVIDSSSDALEIQQELQAAGVHAEHEWTRPQGIYNAMNLGLELARGRFIYFANAGDEFKSPETLGSVRSVIDRPETYWGFGPVEIVESSGLIVVTPSWDYQAEQKSGFSKGHFPPHQGTFVRTTTLKEVGGFDADYSIVADYAAFLRLSLLSDPVMIPFPIARFYEGGTSTQRWKESFRQFHKARKRILKPVGRVALKERVNTVSQYTMVFITREIRPHLTFRYRSRNSPNSRQETSS